MIDVNNGLRGNRGRGFFDREEDKAKGMEEERAYKARPKIRGHKAFFKSEAEGERIVHGASSMKARRRRGQHASAVIRTGRNEP